MLLAKPDAQRAARRRSRVRASSSHSGRARRASAREQARIAALQREVVLALVGEQEVVRFRSKTCAAVPAAGFGREALAGPRRSARASAQARRILVDLRQEQALAQRDVEVAGIARRCARRAPACACASSPSSCSARESRNSISGSPGVERRRPGPRRAARRSSGRLRRAAPAISAQVSALRGCAASARASAAALGGGVAEVGFGAREVRPDRGVVGQRLGRAGEGVASSAGRPERARNTARFLWAAPSVGSTRAPRAGPHGAFDVAAILVRAVPPPGGRERGWPWADSNRLTA